MEISKIKTWSHEALTKQENSLVADFCDDCLSQKEVADKRFISINTVSTHRKNIFDKLGITKITELSKIYFTLSVFLFVASGQVMVMSQRRSSMQIQTTTASRSKFRNRRREHTIPLSANIFECEITA